MDAEYEEIIEKIIDKIGLAGTLDEITDICHAKADHLQTNWQDNVSAKVWTSAAVTISKASAKIDALDL